MSTNPFRRSSLKEASNSASQTAPDPDGTFALPLTVDTRVPNSTQKHVNFASPPAIPISPASYPSSPESTRNSLILSPTQHGLTTLTDYSRALQSDPFREEGSTEEDEGFIEKALQNAKANADMTVPTTVPVRPSKEDAVKDTLSRFASAPRRKATGHETPTPLQASKGHKRNLDVDAFKRLLLTGESGVSAQTAPAASSGAPAPTSDSSSNTDTASLSQRSIQEGGHQTVEETPRSSYEMDSAEHDHRNSRVLSGSNQNRTKPLPPKPRHGRPITESASILPRNPGLISQRNPDSQTPEESRAPQLEAEDDTPRPKDEDELGQTATKKPPPPPLARRKSQNKTATRPGVVRSLSSRYSLTSESDEALSPAASNTPRMDPPPPPPSRRPNMEDTQGQSVDLPSTLEEDDIEGDTLSTASSRTPSASKRLSHVSFGAPPPIPPPRRNRESSRNSMENQRPSLSVPGLANSARSSSEIPRVIGSTNDNSNVSGSSNAADILADLAALQREVDAARKQSN